MPNTISPKKELKELTDLEIKGAVYDSMIIVELHTNNIKVLNQELNNRHNKPEVKEEKK